jgi:hypothetical protein
LFFLRKKINQKKKSRAKFSLFSDTFRYLSKKQNSKDDPRLRLFLVRTALALPWPFQNMFERSELRGVWGLLPQDAFRSSSILKIEQLYRSIFKMSTSLLELLKASFHS